MAEIEALNKYYSNQKSKLLLEKELLLGGDIRYQLSVTGTVLDSNNCTTNWTLYRNQIIVAMDFSWSELMYSNLSSIKSDTILPDNLLTKLTGTITFNDLPTCINNNVSSKDFRWNSINKYFYFLTTMKSDNCYWTMNPIVASEISETVYLFPLQHFKNDVNKVTNNYFTVGKVCGVATNIKYDLSSLTKFPERAILYTCGTQRGDCGSLVYSNKGIVGMHIGNISNSDGIPVLNVYHSFVPLNNNSLDLPPHVMKLAYGMGAKIVKQKGKSKLSHSLAFNKFLGNPSEFNLPIIKPSKPKSFKIKGENHFKTIQESLICLKENKKVKKTVVTTNVKPKEKKVIKSKKESIVSMTPAPSDYLGPTPYRKMGLVPSYVEMLMNPWSSNLLRLPDHMVAPTALAKLLANRTYTIANTATNGSNLLFALNTRISMSGINNAAVAEQAGINFSATPPYPPVSAFSVYQTTPGSILYPIQWGANAYANPTVAFTKYDGTAYAVAEGPWNDDFGSSLSQTLPHISAYRALSAAIRVRIVGLPSGVFMTPGKIYFAQVRYDNEDLPITEQDFVVLEQKGRATHVSADAVRAAGSKTLFWTPDGAEKFGMSSNFLLAPGIMKGAVAGISTRWFPSYIAASGVPNNALASIIPYLSSAYTGNNLAVSDSSDSHNADSTSLLVVAYFGAQDGVVIECDYALTIEYIPNKQAPASVEAQVQLPNSTAMDEIFSSAAVLSSAKPLIIQSKGDNTIINPTNQDMPTKESRLVANKLVNISKQSKGKLLKEGFWDFDWLRTGSFGQKGNGLSWNFSGK